LTLPLGFGPHDAEKIQKTPPRRRRYENQQPSPATHERARRFAHAFGYNPAVPTIRTRGRLPHWEADKAIYFVTFRLADSLAHNVRRAFEFEKRDIVATAKQAGRPLSATEEKRLEKLISKQIQTKLDSGVGACFLAQPAVADLVAETLKHFEASRYRMYAWCVMPNHVHALFRLLRDHSLAEVLQAWKSYSGKKANQLLGRSGEFWQHEYYDHLVRSEEEFYRIVNYIAANPSRAGLRDWRWVGVNLQA
jgi:menaquinone-specific isochorismate synthase